MTRYRPTTDPTAPDLDVDVDAYSQALMTLHQAPTALRDGNLAAQSLRRIIDDLERTVVVVDSGRADPPRIRLAFRGDVSGGHVHADLFVNLARDDGTYPPNAGGRAGQLVLRVDEHDALVAILRAAGVDVEVTRYDPRGT